MIAPLDKLNQQDALYSADYYSNANDADSKRDLKSLDSDGELYFASNVSIPLGTSPRDKIFFDVSLPIVNLPISNAGISADDFTIPKSEKLEQTQNYNTELQLFCEWINANQCSSAVDLATFSGRIKSFAQVFNQISLRDSVLIIWRHDGSEGELIIVLNDLGK